LNEVSRKFPHSALLSLFGEPLIISSSCV
jgi:hypothetical protein